MFILSLILSFILSLHSFSSFIQTPSSSVSLFLCVPLPLYPPPLPLYPSTPSSLSPTPFLSVPIPLLPLPLATGKEFHVDDEFVKYWRGVAVDGIDDGKIEEYLNKHGITSMQDAPGKRLTGKDLKRKRGKQKAKIVNNEHLKDVLEDYSDKAALGGKKFDC